MNTPQTKARTLVYFMFFVVAMIFSTQAFAQKKLCLDFEKPKLNTCKNCGSSKSSSSKNKKQSS